MHLSKGFHLIIEAILLLKWVAINEHFISVSQASSVITTPTSYPRHSALLLTQGMQATAPPPQTSHVFLTLLVIAGNSNFWTLYSG